jgi:hypothetical protein
MEVSSARVGDPKRGVAGTGGLEEMDPWGKAPPLPTVGGVPAGEQ